MLFYMLQLNEAFYWKLHSICLYNNNTLTYGVRDKKLQSNMAENVQENLDRQMLNPLVLPTHRYCKGSS